MENKPSLALYCVDVIGAVMQNRPVSKIPTDVSLQDLFDFSKLHGMEAMIYHGLSTLDIDKTDPTWALWSNRAEMLLTQSIVQLCDRDALFEALTGANIRLLPVKGCWLKEAYPQIDYRQMSDLDMLIHEKDREKAKTILLEMGFAEEEEHAAHHDSYLKTPYTAVELHVQLLPNDSEYFDYYSNVWEKAKPEEGFDGLYRLTAEDEYIFYFLHLKKHVDESGCGIRSVLDCLVYRNTYPHMDRAYLNREFEKLGICDFVENIERLSDCWFRSGEPIPEALTALANEVLWAGTYGTLENVYQKEMDLLKKKYKLPALCIIVYWLRHFFRPMWEMKNLYPILEKFPFLLPFTWFARMFKKCINRPAELLYQIKKVFKEGTKNG